MVVFQTIVHANLLVLKLQQTTGAKKQPPSHLSESANQANHSLKPRRMRQRREANFSESVNQTNHSSKPRRKREGGRTSFQTTAAQLAPPQ